MDINDYNAAKTLRGTIDEIDSVQAKLAASGSKGIVLVANSTGAVLTTKEQIVAAIGDAAYNTICADALTALSDALATAETAKAAEFDALGS